MRAFFILALFFLVFLLVAVNSMAGVDLTPNTALAVPAAAAQAPAPAISSPTAPVQVINIQENVTSPSQSSVLLPVTGGCSDPYTVRVGDTLSQIAVNCRTTLAFLTQLNPQMSNVDCMYPGQQINIHNNTAQQFAPCRQAAPQIEAAPASEVPVEVAIPVVALPAACACYAGTVPDSGLRPLLIPGTGLIVTALNFPPNTPVNVAIGPRTTGYTVVASGVTDANGMLTTRIIIPSAPDLQTAWVVVVLTTTPAPMRVMSAPFYIGL